MAMTDEQRRIDAGCKCKECFGLAEVMILSAGHDFGLPRAPGHKGTTRLQIVTRGKPKDAITFDGPLAVAKPCTGGMLCDCPKCSAQIAARVKRGPSGSGPQQPWQPRPARRAA